MSADTLPPRIEDPGMSEESILKGTGKSWDEWFSMLDAWGAIDKTHTEIARYLYEEAGTGLNGWWSQCVTVGYERVRGRRKINETLQGFAGSASKTVPVSVERLYQAVLDESQRDQWLEPEVLTLRTGKENRTARFNIATGGILECYFTSKGEAKSNLVLNTNGLADREELETWKAFWKERLARLASFLGNGTPS